MWECIFKCWSNTEYLRRILIFRFSIEDCHVVQLHVFSYCIKSLALTVLHRHWWTRGRRTCRSIIRFGIIIYLTCNDHPRQCRTHLIKPQCDDLESHLRYYTGFVNIYQRSATPLYFCQLWQSEAVYVWSKIIIFLNTTCIFYSQAFLEWVTSYRTGDANAFFDRTFWFFNVPCPYIIVMKQLVGPIPVGLTRTPYNQGECLHTGVRWEDVKIVNKVFSTNWMTYYCTKHWYS